MNIKLDRVRKNHLPVAKLIIDSVCFETLAEYYHLPEDIDFTPLCAMLQTIALSEVNHHGGDCKNIENWLRGLPSVITIPFMNYEIEQWLLANDFIKENDKENKKDFAIDNYWNVVAFAINSYAYKNRKQLNKAG